MKNQHIIFDTYRVHRDRGLAYNIDNKLLDKRHISFSLSRHHGDLLLEITSDLLNSLKDVYIGKTKIKPNYYKIKLNVEYTKESETIHGLVIPRSELKNHHIVLKFKKPYLSDTLICLYLLNDKTTYVSYIPLVTLPTPPDTHHSDNLEDNDSDTPYKINSPPAPKKRHTQTQSSIPVEHHASRNKTGYQSKPVDESRKHELKLLQHDLLKKYHEVQKRLHDDERRGNHTNTATYIKYINEVVCHIKKNYGHLLDDATLALLPNIEKN